MKDLIQFISEGGSTERYHTRPGIKADTVRGHSHGVTLLCSLLVPTDDAGRTTATATLLMAAATHDLAEQRYCDVSAPAKRSMGISSQWGALENGLLATYSLEYESQLTNVELEVLKLADCFDGMLYCCRELALGNRTVLLVWRRYCAYVTTLINSGSLQVYDRAQQMFTAIQEIYHETTSPQGLDFDVFQDKPCAQD